MTTTKFIIHDVNFENIDDWDLFNQGDMSSNSITDDEPLNPNLKERSIRDIINFRKESLANRLIQLQRNPISEHRSLSSINGTNQNPVML